jgi:hypothetical protein
VVGQKTNVHKDGLVLGGCAREGGSVEELPCHGGVGVAAHVGAVALAGAVLEVREGRGRRRPAGCSGGAGAGAALLRVVPLLALFELRSHHFDGGRVFLDA